MKKIQILFVLIAASNGAEKKRTKRDLIDADHFDHDDENETVVTSFDRLKNAFRSTNFFSCPRLLKQDNPFELEIEMNSMGFSIIKPKTRELNQFSFLLREQLKKEKQGIDVFDESCTNKAL